MKIELNAVFPIPMRNHTFSEESTWGKIESLLSTENNIIIAPSGTGKSSLVAFLYGMRNDYSGRILFDGKDCSKFSLREWTVLRREKVSCVFQDLRLIPNLSVEENLELKNNLTQHKNKSEISAMLERVGVSHQLKQKAATLSFGQQQRVAIIRSLLQPFDLLILDEPFSHLDQENIRLCSDLILENCKQNNAGILVFSLGDRHHFNYAKELKL